MPATPEYLVIDEEPADPWYQEVPGPSLYLLLIRAICQIEGSFAELPIAARFIRTFLVSNLLLNVLEMHI